MSVIINIIIHIESTEYIQNNQRIMEIAREAVFISYTYEMARTKNTFDMYDVGRAVSPRGISIRKAKKRCRCCSSA
jgi:hypothetical protein